MFLHFSTSANNHICSRFGERQQSPFCVLSLSFSKNTDVLISPLCSSNKRWKRKNPPLQLHFSGAGPIAAYAGLLSQQEAAVAEFHMDDCGLRGPTLKYQILCSFPLILHALCLWGISGVKLRRLNPEQWAATKTASDLLSGRAATLSHTFPSVLPSSNPVAEYVVHVHVHAGCVHCTPYI